MTNEDREEFIVLARDFGSKMFWKGFTFGGLLITLIYAFIFTVMK